MAISDQDRRTILAWAETHAEILEVWLYGSRARGDFRADSDINLAVVTAGANVGQRYRTWSGAEWRVKLHLSQRVQIEWYDPDAVDLTIVGPAVRHDGQLIYWTRDGRK